MNYEKWQTRKAGSNASAGAPPRPVRRNSRARVYKNAKQAGGRSLRGIEYRNIVPVLYERQDRLTWRQWQVGTLRYDPWYLLSYARIGQVLELSDKTVKEVCTDVRWIAHEYGDYLRLVERREGEGSDWSPRNLEPFEQLIWNRWRPRNFTKTGRVTDAPDRPWHPNMLFGDVRDAGFGPYRDTGSIGGLVWRKAGMDWHPFAPFDYGPMKYNDVGDMISAANENEENVTASMDDSTGG